MKIASLVLWTGLVFLCANLALGYKPVYFSASFMEGTTEVMIQASSLEGLGSLPADAHIGVCTDDGYKMPLVNAWVIILIALGFIAVPAFFSFREELANLRDPILMWHRAHRIGA